MSGPDESDRANPEPAAAGVLPLAEEHAEIDKRKVARSRVTVQTRSEIIEETIPTSLTTERAEITRVPIDKVVEAPPPVRTEGDVTIVPVLEEVAVVTRQLVLREELHIRRIKDTETVAVPVQLRRQRVEVDRAPTSPDEERQE